MNTGSFENAVGELLGNEFRLGIAGHGGPIQICLVYPNSYSLGSANLGFNRIWQLLDCQPEFNVERAFYLEPPHRAVPKSWESKRHFGAFHILAFSLSSEEDYPAVLEFLMASGIPMKASKRSPRDPIVIAGGLAPTLNPRPLSLYLDALFVGEGELLIPSLERIVLSPEAGWNRDLVLERMAVTPGIWVPTLKELETPIASWKFTDAPIGPARSMAISPHSHFGKMFLIEVGRGCGRLCYYCATCYSVPHRIWPIEIIEDAIKQWILPPGPVGLVGAALSDHPHLHELINELVLKGYRLGLSSFRADILDQDLLVQLRRGHVETITIAPEAGSETLRARIGKPISNDRIIETARWIGETGFPRLRCYFMTGLPGETPDDIEALIFLARTIQSTLRSLPSQTRLDLRINPFVPKPGTPFQWAPFALETVLRRSHQRIRSALEAQHGLTLRFTPPSEAWREALFCRGDERVGLAIEEAIRTGKSLRQTAMQFGIDLKTITHPLTPDQPLPWQHIQRHISPQYLEKQWYKSTGPPSP
jgi:radical SAM superfamily enzyme YgiQ (UPF0313 family)